MTSTAVRRSGSAENVGSNRLTPTGTGDRRRDGDPIGSGLGPAPSSIPTAAWPGAIFQANEIRFREWGHASSQRGPTTRQYQHDRHRLAPATHVRRHSGCWRRPSEHRTWGIRSATRRWVAGSTAMIVQERSAAALRVCSRTQVWISSVTREVRIQIGV